TSVVAHEDLPTNDELGGADGTVLARASDVAYFGVRERRGVELDRGFELVVEHEERCHFVHGECLLCEGDALHRPTQSSRPSVSGYLLGLFGDSVRLRWITPICQPSPASRTARLSCSGLAGQRSR